jgi:hypothetical protein
MDRQRRRRTSTGIKKLNQPLVGSVLADRNRLGKAAALQPSLSPRQQRRRTGGFLPRPVIVGSIVIVVAWWFLSPLKRIQIPSGTANQDEIRTEINAYFQTHSNRNMLINTSALSATLKQNVLHATDARVYHDLLLSTVRIDVASDHPALRWQTGGIQYTVSGQGVVLYQTPSKGEEALPVVLDGADLPLEIKTRVVPADFVEYLKELESAAKSKGLVIRERQVRESIREIEISLEKRPYLVRMRTSGRAGEHIDALVRLENFFRKESTVPKSYVDLRIPNRAYWR